MSNPELIGDSFLIIGFGREGRSVHSFLQARYPEARIGIADRELGQRPQGIDISTEIYSGPTYLAEAHSFSTVIRSPGVSIREVRPHLGVDSHLTSATNIFFAECPGKIVGVTGTKGKSTTSSLTAAILKQEFSDVRLVGNIGTPMLDHLHDASSATLFVIELSSYQLEDLKRSPDVALLLNIVPEHLDYHGGFDNYCDAKLSIAKHQTPRDLLIFNDSHPVLLERTANCRGTRMSFSEHSHSNAPIRVENDTIVVRKSGNRHEVLPCTDLPVLGPGNLQNALAAITCAVALGVSIEKIQEGLRTFKPLEHRLEFVAERCGIRFYNDSLSTIPEALAHALVALGPDVETIIAGGFDRGVDMTMVGSALAASNVKNLILFPTTGEKIWRAAVTAQPNHRYRRVDVENMDDAVQVAYDLTSPGKICAMSPASSSFSVFRDYKDRGDQFKDAVMRLSPKHPEETPPQSAR